MALSLSNSAAVKATADFLRKSTAYERPFPADQILQLANAGAVLATGMPGGVITGAGSTGATQNILQTHPISGLLNLILKYGQLSANYTPVQQAHDLLILGTAIERPLDQESSELLYAFAQSVGFSQFPPAGFLDALRDAPISTLIYLLYWVGTPSAANPYSF